MRVVVLGGGIVGVTTAYQLARDGHEVTVVERNPAVARETSFANAGLVAPGHAYAWSSPQAPMMLLRSLWRDDQALRFKLRPDPRLYSWSLLFLRQCTAERAAANTRRKHKLCRYSQQAFRTLLEETPLDYDGQGGGLLYLYRSQESFDRGAANTGILAEGGQAIEVIDRERAVAIDPALASVKERLAGAIFCPSDESGDSCKFTEALAAECESRGVTMALDTTILGLETDGDRVAAVATDKGRYEAEAFVLALGVMSPQMVRRLGVKLPIYPVKGYSATLPVGEGHVPPTLGGVDEDNLTAYAKLGDRLRITATAEFAGYDTGHRPSDFAGMLAVGRDLFPEGADWSKPDYWACLRPMTPEGSPILGAAGRANLYLNVGHGHMGWTMACGTARITADLIAGRRPEHDLEGLTLD